MRFDRDTLKRFQFSKTNSININCSTCHKGVLSVVPDKFIKEKTAYVKASEKEDYFNGYDYEAKVCYLFMCNNRKCQEPYLAVGIEFEDIQFEYDHRSGDSEEVEITTFRPLFFTPTVHIFNLHNSIPKSIANELVKSFSLFFSDLSSAANKIRISVELLMNEFNVPPSHYLDARIKEFEKTHVDIAGKLLATKIIGNSGSHVAEISKDDVIDAYEIMDYVLEELYTRKARQAEVHTIAANIVAKEKQRKKPQI